MEKNALIARLAIEVVTSQIAAGAKHPSPALITEAVATAHAVVDELEKQEDERETAAAAAEKKAALDAAAATAAAKTVMADPKP